MSEWVNESWRYDASPEAAFRMLTRLDHLTEQAAHLGYERFAVRELREREGYFRVATERLMPDARRGRPMLRHTQRWHPPTWDGARRYDAVAELGGPALTVTAQGLLRPAEQGASLYSIRLSVHSASRFFGRQVERDVALGLLAVLAGEHEFRERWLAGRTFPDERCA